jgi:hypothetical protein
MSFLAALLALVGSVVFSFVDPTIDESSGLVDLGELMVTTNDSGGDPLVFVVDAKSGRTVARTTFAEEVRDVEALAPAGSAAVWVADIGDNREERDSVQVYRVPVGRDERRVEAPAFGLVYPDGAHDAESLLAGPDGRLYVITKELFGGTAYVAPRKLDPAGPNRLRQVGSVDVWATDAALFPDGKHVFVRGYGTAAIYSFPGFRPVASFDLPRQKQGEGVSIGSSGRIRLSSEGVHSPVVQVALPDAVRAIVEGDPPAESPSAPASPAAGDADPVEQERDDGSSPVLLIGGTLVLVVAVGGAIAVIRRRR